jgi:PhzF family phenazine biosynthesis protein
MKRYRVYQVDVFTKRQFQGNPAGVVPNADGLTKAQMHEIAADLNNSETAFLFSSSSLSYDVGVRFFKPSTEVPSCGHATIAAHYVCALENRLQSGTVRQKIRIGILPVYITQCADDYEIVMTQGNIEFSPPFEGGARQYILNALKLSADDLDERCPMQIVSTGHSKVLIGIKSRRTLNALRPELSCLREISEGIDCKGYFVFTLDSNTPEILTYGRVLASSIGIPEDPATGNAHGSLRAYLVKHHIVENDGARFAFRGRQGETLGRMGTVNIEINIENGEPIQAKIGS